MFDSLIEKLTSTVVQEAEKTRLSLQEGFASSLRGSRLHGALTLQVPSAPTSAQLLYNGPGRLMGWTLRNSAGAGAIVVNLYDGADNTAPLVATVSIGSGSAWQQSSAWFGPTGLAVAQLLTLELIVASGTPTLAGAVYYERG